MHTQTNRNKRGMQSNQNITGNQEYKAILIGGEIPKTCFGI